MTLIKHVDKLPIHTELYKRLINMLEETFQRHCPSPAHSFLQFDYKSILFLI